MKLEGKAAIVAGGAGGIGRGIAMRFAQEGARIAVVDRDLEAGTTTVSELRANGADAAFFECDVGNRTAVELMTDRAVDAFGSIDILVANAAIMDRAPLLETTEATFDEVVSTNVRGVFACTIAAGRRMAANGGGVVLVVTSVEDDRGVPTSGVPYTMSKGAQRALVRAGAVHLAPHGIRVVGLAPGMVPSGLNQYHPRGSYDNIPAARLGTVEDMAGAAAFLVSDEAAYVNGSTLYVDGGWLGVLA